LPNPIEGGGVGHETKRTLDLILALSYSSKWEMVEAIKQLIDAGVSAGGGHCGGASVTTFLPKEFQIQN
jgi:hypothetical protein